jgi:site-specific DNA-methyltransferase (cytosine-N4-specific)
LALISIGTDGTVNRIKTQQLTLFDFSCIEQVKDDWSVKTFSADSRCCDCARQALEAKFLPFTVVTEKFNRQSVSYQLSKRDCIHSWLKYKEGFSAHLVESLMDEMGIKKGSTVLDPFLGSGTTSFVAQIRGINSIGFDIMPMTAAAMYAKSNIAQYNVDELNAFLSYIRSAIRPNDYDKCVNYINITNGAYPKDTERDIPYFSDLIGQSHFSPETKGLGTLCILNSLERVSFTAKDGQYLRWDERSKKVIDANAARIAASKKPFSVILNKGVLPKIQKLLTDELEKAIRDIQYLQSEFPAFGQQAAIVYKQGSSLTELPLLADKSINGVITSPPYCNRYDYTRIYALELAHLGMGEREIRQARQDLLTCTVESKTKLQFLKDYYSSINKGADYNTVVDIINSNAALTEVISALKYRSENGDVNNNGILRMVKGYFEELAFIYFELFRLCRSGAGVAFVNDNVRYAGEVIPVDFISTELACQIGFKPVKIYTLRQQKGNSSQQMKKFGRIPLRKSITIWIKE